MLDKKTLLSGAAVCFLVGILFQNVQVMTSATTLMWIGLAVKTARSEEDG